MSYCRKGVDSDVYMFPHIYGGIMCMGCSLNPNVLETVFNTYEGAIAHLYSHIEAGDKVPDYSFERLEEERASSKVLAPYTVPEK